MIHPSHRLFHELAESPKWPYRDHLGRFVFFDVEGPGQFKFSNVEAALVDEAPTPSSSGLFLSCALAFGDSGEAWALTGPEPEFTEKVWVDLPVSGSGFLWEGSVDLITGPHNQKSDAPFPMPFYAGMEGRGKALVSNLAAPYSHVQTLRIGDPEGLKLVSFKVQNLSALNALSSSFAPGFERTAQAASHLNTASWRVEFPQPPRAILLTKVFDRFHGRQRARVLVDGRSCGYWYEPQQDRVHRWATGSFGIGPEHLDGAASLVLSIDPPSGTPLWSVSEIRIWAAYGEVDVCKSR